ncbi:12169_t:CDS:1, partial [Ambispora leptoticha]
LMTGHSTATITNNIDKIRQMIGSQVQDTHQKIGGLDIIVEIDESLFGRVKYHRGKPVKGVWVIGGVERTHDRRIF